MSTSVYHLVFFLCQCCFVEFARKHQRASAEQCAKYIQISACRYVHEHLSTVAEVYIK